MTIDRTSDKISTSGLQVAKDEEIYLVINEAHETYNMSVYEDSLLEENLNQNDDVETNDIDYKLREISKAVIYF
ncbi:hypothetical protein RhiirC2_856238 [Rhizophagus irregularis]|uniref:Uncharacterized protein n=1 Tax=Rhizophagus irregularis TaxID=588596 RepID=A0A2N1MIJ6_9GLOM|nr:hypothetical protein RhiirC2_856238 [Rhizophagus irregularis]